MGNWAKITLLELRLAARDRESVIWSLIAPIIMAWLFGNLFDAAPPKPVEVVVDRGDNPAWVEQMFVSYSVERGLNVTEEAELRVVIPDSVIAHIVRGDEVEAQVVKGDASSLRGQNVAVKVREILYALVFVAQESWIETPPGDAEIAAITASDGPLFLEASTRGKAPRIVAGHVHQLPATLVMFLMFQLTTFFVMLWVEDLSTGKLRRIVMSPTSMRDIFVAQLLSRMAWGLVQVIVVLGVGSMILDVEFEVPNAYFAVMLLAYMVAAISLGLLLGTFFRSPDKANAIGVAVGLLLAALGGCWWPLEVVESDLMRNIAMALPTGAMMDAVGGFIALGKDAPFPTLNMTILVGMSVVMMPIAIRRMRVQVMKLEGEA